MNIGLLREGKNPPDKRVAFSPSQCSDIMKSYPELSLYAQPSQNRCFLHRIGCYGSIMKYSPYGGYHQH